MASKARLYALTSVVAAALAGCILQDGSLLAAQTQNASAVPSAKTAEQQFKNIQVLKGVPADQVIPTMQFISGSLGVECEFCHVEAAFDKDDKKPKLAARKMITMVMAINKDNFEGHREVTCNSCHRGNPHPSAIPAVASAQPAGPMEHAHAEEHEHDEDMNSGQSADPILDRYLAAVGGADAIKKISSRVEKGTASIGERRMPIDIFIQAPDKRVSYLHLPNGDSITAYDGSKGWLGNPGRPPHPMGPGETEAARMDADLYFPAHLKEIFTSFKVGESEKIGDQEAVLVRALRDGKAPVNLYFDHQSGYLVRMVRYADTALGLLPTQIDYADYRDSGGVKVPFRWTIARPSGRFTIQVDHADANVPIDASKFAQPPAPPKAPGS
jgi:photosynthetic reaction center cytochrome c subunit